MTLLMCETNDGAGHWHTPLLPEVTVFFGGLSFSHLGYID